MMDMIVNMVAEKIGIPPQMAKMAIPLISKFVLQKSTPDQASGLLSSLPTDLTGMFSDEEKKGFTTTQENLSEEDLVGMIDSKCGINDKGKSQQVVSEVMKALQGNSGQGQGDMLGSMLGKVGKGDFNPFG
ncbi:MAG: hypothetical protein ACE5DL_04115 [Nitrosopumilaceae archaeon]